MQQGRPLEELKFRAKWTWGWGPPFVVRLSHTSLIYRPLTLESLSQVITVICLILSMSEILTCAYGRGMGYILTDFSACRCSSRLVILRAKIRSSRLCLVLHRNTRHARPLPCLAALPPPPPNFFTPFSPHFRISPLTSTGTFVFRGRSCITFDRQSSRERA